MQELPEVRTGYCSIHNMLFISYLPKIINAAIEAGVFEALSGQQLTVEMLAESLETELGVTAALCDVLAELEMLAKDEGGYTLTAVSEDYLVSGSLINQLDDVKKFDGSSGPFDNLVEILKGGAPEFDQSMWTSKEAMESMAQGARAGMIQRVTGFITSLQGFADWTSMCDLAGSIGHYSLAITGCSEKLSSAVYDLPQVVQIGRELQEGKGTKVSFYPFDAKKDKDFGDGYDLFFVSHFLYEYGHNGSLAGFLRRVNRSLTPGGVFVSNHMPDVVPDDYSLTVLLVELLTRCVGYPAHNLPRQTLEDALEEAGFGDFTVEEPISGPAYPTLLLAARKLRNV